MQPKLRFQLNCQRTSVILWLPKQIILENACCDLLIIGKKLENFAVELFIIFVAQKLKVAKNVIFKNAIILFYIFILLFATYLLTFTMLLQIPIMVG